jgi:F-type H+-transporting ATPase subunit gamma
MSTLKELKNRIKSINSTKQVTGAMKMVSAARLRKARNHLEASVPYSTTMGEVFSRLASIYSLSPDEPKLIAGSGEEKKYLLIVPGASRGLCGAFNVNIKKAIREKINSLKASGKEVKIITLGSKIREVIQKELGSYIIKSFDEVVKSPNFRQCTKIRDYILELFNNDEFDVSLVYYTKFINVMTQQIDYTQVLPFVLPAHPKESFGGGDEASEYEFEPRAREMLLELIPSNIAAQIYYALLENAASEQGARMTAMDNASNNAKDLVDNLTVDLNRKRQAAITKELNEIISGAEAV